MAFNLIEYANKNKMTTKNRETPSASTGGFSLTDYYREKNGITAVDEEEERRRRAQAEAERTVRLAARNQRIQQQQALMQPKVNLEPNQYTTRVGYTDTASSNYSREDILRMLADDKVAREQEQQRQKQYGNTAAKVESAYTLPEAPIGTPTIGAEGIIRAAEAAAAERKNKLRADLGYRDESGVYSASNAAADYTKISKATGISEDELRTYAKANDMGAQRQAYTALILNGDMSLDEFKNVSRQYNVSDEDAEGLYAYYGIEGLRQKIREAADNPYKMQGQYEIARYVEKQLKDRGYTAYGYKAGKYIMPAEYAEVILRETNAPEGGYTAENLAEYPARALALCAVDVTKNPEWEKEADQIYEILYNNLFDKNDDWGTAGSDIWTTVANNIRETARPTAAGIILGLAKGLGSESIAKMISDDVNEKFDTSYARVSQLAPTATNIANTAGTIGLFTSLAYLTGGVASSVVGAGASVIGASAASAGAKLATGALAGAMTFGSVTALQNLGDYYRGNINLAEYGERVGQSEIVGAATSLVSGLVSMGIDKAFVGRLSERYARNIQQQLDANTKMEMLSSDAVSYMDIVNGNTAPLLVDIKSAMPTMQTSLYLFTRNIASSLAGSGAFVATNALVTGKAPTNEEVAYQFALGFFMTLIRSSFENTRMVENIRSNAVRMIYETARAKAGNFAEAINARAAAAEKIGGDIKTQAQALVVELENLRRALRNEAAQYEWTEEAVRELATYDLQLAMEQQFLMNYAGEVVIAGAGDTSASAAGGGTSTAVLTNLLTTAMEDGITKGAVTPEQITTAALALPAGAESITPDTFAAAQEGAINAGIPYAANQFAQAMAPDSATTPANTEARLTQLAEEVVTPTEPQVAPTATEAVVAPVEAERTTRITPENKNAKNEEITAPRADTAQSWEKIGRDFGEDGQRAFAEAYNPEFTSGELDTVGRVFTAFYNAGKNNAGVFSVPESVRASVDSIYASPNDATAMEAAAYTAGINDARLTTDARNDIIVSQETEGGNTYGRQGRELRVPRVSVRESVQSTREQGSGVSSATGENQEGRIDSRRGAESGRNGEQNARGVQEVQAGQKVSPKQLGLKYGTDKQNTVVTPSNETLKTAYRHGVKVTAVKGALEMRGDDGKTFRVNGASFVDPETGEHTMVVQSDNPKYAERQIVLHEATHEELRQGRVSRQEVHDTINELANSEEEVWELFNAYAREYGERYTEKQILDEIFCDAKAAIDRWGVKGAKKAMDSIRRAAGKVYEASRMQAEQSESSGNDAAMSRSDDRMNNPGEIRNGFDKALSRSEWRSYYQAIADEGYLTADVGEYAVIPVSNKVVISQKQRITNTTQDFQALAVIITTDNASLIAEQIRKVVEGNANEDDRAKLLAVIGQNEGVTVFGEHAGEYTEYALDNSEDQKRGVVRGVSDSRREQHFGKRVSEQSKQDIRKSDGLRVSDADNGEDGGVSFSREDSTGRELSEGQQEYFKDSKIRDDEGRLQVVYHGTEADFTVFDTSIQGGKNGEAEGFGIYITPSKAVTEHYGGRQMEMYANITKPARSDVKTIGVTKLAKLIESTARAEAKTLVEEEGYDTISDALKDTWISNYVNTYDMPINVAYAEVAQWILGAESGDMGVVQEVMAGMGIRDYEDAMEFYREHLVPVTGFDGFATAWENKETGNKVPIYLAFESSQLKNVDNLNPTESDDINFSREEDAEYLRLAEDPEANKAELQRMVKDAAKAAGYNSPKLYHGTGDFGFTQPRGMLFATDSIETANTYGVRLRGINEEGSNVGTYQLYANTDGMLVLDADGAETNHIALGDIERGFNRSGITKSWHDFATINQIIRYAKENGYTGVVVKNVRDAATPDGRRNLPTATDYVFFKPNEQLKSADPVTYDDNGNVIPLSERFNSENNDIRYSPEEGVNADLAAEFKALQRENAALRERLAAAKGQLKRTEQPTVRSDDVRKVARSVIKRYDSNANTDYVAQKMEDLGNLIVRGSDEKGDATYTRIKEAASDIMYDIIAGSDSVYDADVIESHKRIRDTLRTTKLYVSPSERADAAIDSDSYEQFRKKNFGTLNLTSDPKALRVDVFYQELVDQYPWMFDRDITSQGDMLREMVDAANAPLTPSYNIAEEAEVEADDLLWRLMGEEVRQVETFADKAARKQAQAVAHESNKLNAARDKIAALKEEVAAEKAKKEALRKQKNRIIEEIKRKHSAEREDARERKERREAEDRLLGMLRRVNNTKLSTPNRAWFEKYFGDIYTVAKHLTGNKLATAEDLQKKYAELKENDPDFIGSQRLEEDLAAILDKRKDVASMTDEEIGDYTYVLMEFLHQVQEGNKMTRIADRTDVRMQAYNVMSNVIATKGVPASGIVKQIQDATVTNALDALRAVRRYTGYNDSDPLYLRTRELAEGQRAADMYIMQAKAAFSNLLSNKKFVRFFTGPHAAEIEIRGTDANTNESVTLKITPALRTALYLNNQNDDNRRHITYGGVNIPDINLLKKVKIKEAFARGRRVKFTPKEMTAITSGMTKEELDFARLTNSYFGETSPRAISEVYEALFGVPLKLVDAGYYPLLVADGWTRGNADTIDINAMAFDSPNDIGSPGWLKERKESIAPIYLFPADMVVDRSINDHGRYVGLAIPADNFNKLWEAKLYKKETRYNKLKGLDETYFAPDRALKDVIAGKWGTRAKNNVDSFFNQILGRESRMRDTRFGRFRSRYAKSVLELNPSVALKQMPSGIAAAAVVGYAPLAKAVNPALKIDTSFIDKMTASYLMRKEGYSQQELGELAQRGKKLPPALSWIIGADLATTGMLKRAAAFYVRDNMKELEVGSDAYKKAVVEVYDNIISETQPTYDVIYRANVLRSSSEITRALNMFRTQPFKNFNILYDALGNLQAKRNAYHEANRWAADDEQSQRYAEEAKAAYHDAKKRAVWAFTSQAASGMLISLIMAGWDMLRGKKKKYADEDGEVTLWSFLKGLGLNFASTGAGMIPYGGVLLEGVESLVDAVSGDDIFDTTMYGFSVPEVELMNDTASGVVKLVRSLRAALVAEEGADWEEIGRSLYNATEQIAQFMGIPLQNARKTVEVMARQVFKAEGEYVGEYMALRMQSAVDSNKKAYYDLLYKAYKDDAEQYKTIYDNLIDNGLSENAIKSAMETRMKKAEGAASVDELSSRYLSPSQQKTYDAVTRRVKSSEVWAESDASNRAKLSEIAYEVIAGNKRNSWQSESVTTENNLTQTEYILYKLALDIVDKPNSNGNYGTYTDSEKAAAVKKAKQG